MGQLRGPEARRELVAENSALQERLRREHEAKRAASPLLPLAEARARRTPLDWSGYEPPAPEFTGARLLDAVRLEELVPLVDWTPLFVAWELRGTYPRIFDNPEWGSRARELFDDAQRLLERIVRERRLVARAAYGFFPAASVGDDIEVYADATRSGLLATFPTLRQQSDKGAAEPCQALADFVAPAALAARDFVGAFAVTAGLGADALVAGFERDHDDYGAIMAKALADRLAEALAEWLHRRVRAEWGYGRDERLDVADLIRERYRGIRPAPGYPACPDHSEKPRLFELLGGEAATGIRLTESFAMLPAASVCGLYFSHPQARYFSVGRIGRDQAEDYAHRKGLALREVERWLAPNLDYEVGAESAGEALLAPARG
jgi:5-methyltetrahydrofolate--homocysteine methyltransferase